MGTKKPSFGSAKLSHLNAEIPDELLRDFRAFVGHKGSRLNLEIAEAIQLYLQTYRPVRTPRQNGHPSSRHL